MSNFAPVRQVIVHTLAAGICQLNINLVGIKLCFSGKIRILKISHGVLQSSVPGPLLFRLYMLCLGNIIRNHSINFHYYANGTQLYLLIKADEIN